MATRLEKLAGILIAAAPPTSWIFQLLGLGWHNSTIMGLILLLMGFAIYLQEQMLK